jgi:hypothetical protein
MRVIIKQDRLINRTERSSDDATIVSGVGASSSSSCSDENGIFRATEREREREKERIARQATTFAQGRLKKNEAIDLAPMYRQLKRRANGLCECIRR